MKKEEVCVSVPLHLHSRLCVEEITEKFSVIYRLGQHATTQLVGDACRQLALDRPGQVFVVRVCKITLSKPHSHERRSISYRAELTPAPKAEMIQSSIEAITLEALLLVSQESA